MRKIKFSISNFKRMFRDRKEHYMIRHNKGKIQSVSIKELLERNSKITGGVKNLFRYDIIVRYLVVSEYYKNSDKGFEIYRKMQDKRMGDGYSVGAEQRFKSLISSYEKNGYDENSRIILDRNYGLIDGSHRIAMALYYGYDNISALILNSVHSVDYSITWFIENGFSDEQISLIKETADELLK